MTRNSALKGPGKNVMILFSTPEGYKIHCPCGCYETHWDFDPTPNFVMSNFQILVCEKCGLKTKVFAGPL